MATEVILQYIGQLYYQPRLTNLSSYRKWNTSHPENDSVLPAYESTEMITFQDEQSELPLSAAHFGLATGLLAILLNSRLFSFKVFKTDARVSKCQQWAEALLPRLFLGLLCLLLTASLTPLVAFAFLLLAVYRHLARFTLFLSRPSFAGLLEGTDAVWALEDDTSKSVINVLAFFEVEIVDNVFNPQLLGMLRRLMRERILRSPDACPKFWQHRRRSRLGYFYWERQEEVRVEEHVQFMTQEDDLVNLEAPDLSEDSFRQDFYGMSESVLMGLVSELANSPLPYDNAASWEILVGRDPILEDFSDTDPFQAMEEGNPEATGRFRRYPVLFRVHHSMGDGVALVKLLLETLADRRGPTDPPRRITATRILGYDNEETTRLTRRRTISRLDSIGLIKCSTGSSEEGNKVKRPRFLDLSPTSLEHSKKKVKADFLVQDATNESVDIFIDKSPNILYTKFSKSAESSRGQDKDDQVFEEVLRSPRKVDDGENYQQNVFCYPAKETILTMDESIESANEIILNHETKTIYFDNKVDYELEETYEKVADYCLASAAENNLELFETHSPPPRRCKSPMPPFKRDVSRIVRVMDEIIETRSRPSTPFIKDDSFSTSSESSVAITLDAEFGVDAVPPLSHVRSPYPGYEAMTIPRNESPVPKIHRKKYPVRFQDEDSEDSPPTPRRGNPPRSDSPFLRDNSPLPYPGRKSALKQNRDRPASRSSTPLPRYNSSIYSAPTERAGSPFQINGIFGPQEHRSHEHIETNSQRVNDENSPSRCPSPWIKSNIAQSHSNRDKLLPGCKSPFMRRGSPLPRNDNPIPRCNSPFMRNNSPIPRNDNPTPRCNSPFVRNNTPITKNDNHISKVNNVAPQLNGTAMSRPNSPFQNDATATKKKTSINQLYITNSRYNPKVGEMLRKPESNLQIGSSINCAFMEHKEETEDKALTNDIEAEKGNRTTMQNVPLTLHSSSAYTEQFIRGHFFSLDSEVINRSAVSPNCFLKLLDSINHRPSTIEQISNYIKNTCALVFAPVSLIHQTMVKAADVNPLHGPDLSGQKVVSWYFDSHADNTENILSTIKRIKTRMSDAKFTDVFLSALSASLESYFLQSGCNSSFIPDTVSVVIPVRMATENEIAEAMALRDEETRKTNSFETEKNVEEDAPPKIPTMENKFSVALLSLPITCVSKDAKLVKPFSPISRLREICKHTDILRKSPDYHINYWLMRVVSKYLPLPLLAPLLNSTQSTMVVSNLLGPPMQLRLGGYHLKDIVFWVPNRGSTGVGVSVLSYAGRLQIGIVADRALIPCQQDANIIIEGIISELKCLDEITAPIKTHPLKV